MGKLTGQNGRDLENDLTAGGGGNIIDTLQQTLTAGSTLTTNNSVVMNGQNFSFTQDNNKGYFAVNSYGNSFLEIDALLYGNDPNYYNRMRVTQSDVNIFAGRSGFGESGIQFVHNQLRISTGSFKLTGMSGVTTPGSVLTNVNGDGIGTWVAPSSGGTALSLTTNGISGIATLSSNILNIPNYTSSYTGYIELTKAEANTLVANSQLIPGVDYFLTDKRYYLRAIAVNKFDIRGTRIQACPNIYSITTQSIGTWRSTKTVTVGQHTVWGGKAWINNTGNIGSSLNDFQLDATNWTRTNNTALYIDLPFEILYEFEYDWVAQQKDINNNIFGLSYIKAIATGFYTFNVATSFNPVDHSDWNYNSTAPQQFSNNKAVGIWNNLHNSSEIKDNDIITSFSNVNIIANNDARIFSNTNKGFITNNGTGFIRGNTNNGNISNNQNIQTIEFNNNLGSISNNTGASGNGNVLSFNSNIGDITGNTTVLTYELNNNTGYIINNATTSVKRNSNIGSIESNGINVGVIQWNNNTGDIRNNNNVQCNIINNSNTGHIQFNTGGTAGNAGIEINSNNGSISSNLIRVSYNNNNGGINSCTGGAILSNNNNGSISGAHASVVSDTVVNK